MKFRYAKVIALVLVSSGIGGSQEPESDIGRNFTSVLQSGGQSAKSISIDVKDTRLSDIIQKIADQAGLQLSWSGKVVLDRKVSLTLKNVDVHEALGKALSGSGAKASISPNGKMIVIVPENPDSLSRQGQATGTIRGRVIDSASKEGVPGVAVSVLGTRAAAVTRSDGTFSIPEVSLGKHTLAARLIGYRSSDRAIVLDEKTSVVNINFTVVASASRLSEVVTTATGQQRRLEVGSDIVKINAMEIMDRAPVRSVTDLLRFAQVPGVNVLTASGEPGSPTRIRMRGIGSISQNSDPSVIVDGIWINSKMSDSSIINKAYGTGATNAKVSYTGSPLDNIDPSTIETIEILRGPSAASLYGHEAANGVIVITTKRGTDGPAAWNYSYSRDWDSQVRAKHGNWLAYGTDPFGNLVSNCIIQRHYNLDCMQDSAVNLSRFGSLLDDAGPGLTNTHRLSVRGGRNRINYSFSTSYQDNIGTRRTPQIDIIKARLLDIPLPGEMQYPGRKKDLFMSSSIGFAATRILNIDFVVNANNSNLQQNEMVFSQNVITPIDTVSILNLETQSGISSGGSDAFNISSALTMKLQPDSWWNISATLGADKGERRDHGRNDFRNCIMGVCEPRQNINSGEYRLRQSSGSTKVLTGRISAGGRLSTPFDRFLSLTPSIRLDVKHNMNSVVVLNLREVPFGADQGSSNGEGTMGTLTSNDLITAGYAFTTTVKVLNRMYFDLGFRQDAGSAIKSNSKVYPRLSTSWVLSEEGFFPKNRLVDVFVLRGVVGYASVHPEDADINGGYRYRQAVINDKIVWVGELGSIGNNKLVPERSVEFEGGFDAQLLGNRVDMGLTIANKNLNNAIVNRNLPVSSGLPILRKENISRVQNRSIEFTLNTRLIDNNQMLVQLGGNISNVNNVIRRLGNGAIFTSNTSKSRLVEGYQIGSVWERPVLGYGDVNGDGFIAESEIILGDTTVYKGWNTPKFTASYNGSISLLNRNLTLSFSLSQQGAHVQSATYKDNYGEVVVGAPLEAQALYVGSHISNGTAMNVSEVRLNSASINYNLPRGFSQRLNSKLIILSLQGSNLGLWTNYSGRDPMVNSTPVGNVISDNGFTLPVPRKFSFNVRVEL